MPDDAVIRTNELTKVYSHPFFFWLVRAWAVIDMTLSVGRGEVFGLLGPNGSGKSTTIKLILGLIFPSYGQVSVFGKRPDDADIKARIGFLPEESYLYRFLDAEETLDFYGRLFGLPRAERRRRIEALLDLTWLRRERRRPVVEFSKGMQRRIGLAQSLINDPELVILDEPTTGLDPIGTREIKDLILELKDKGKTVLLSSHLLADVEDVCDRVAILYGGRVRALGPMEGLLSDERLVQVTAPMDPETVQQVEELIRRREGPAADIRLSRPRARLENVFLGIVEQAREQRVETSGAAERRGRLDFLTEAAPESVVERLARPEAEAARPDGGDGIADARPADGDERRRLADLVAGRDEEETRTPEGAEPDAPAPSENRDVLDRLVEDGDEDDSRG